MIFTTQSELDSCLAKWQKILRLQDWQIIAGIFRDKDMNTPGCHGNIQVFREHHAAKIWLQDQIDWDAGYGVVPNDMEETLVHELCHIFFSMARVDIESANTQQEEWGIIALSRALVALDRQAAGLVASTIPLFRGLNSMTENSFSGNGG